MLDFQSRRSAVTARRGAVATTQPIAAQCGLKVLMDGGHAVDAAVATAAALAVVEPFNTGPGGDLFALVWDSGTREVSALNASGRAGAAASIDAVRAAGFETIPAAGDGAGLAVSVPGTVAGWADLLSRFGRMGLAEVLAPAIDLALEGHVVPEVVAHNWRGAQDKLAALPSGHEFLLDGRAPRSGELMPLPALGRSLQVIAEGGPPAFYEGDIATRIADYVQAHGGCLTPADLAAHRSDWDVPICSDYRDVRVWECPPNGQGIAALMALNVAEGFDLAGMGAQSPACYHHLVEAMRLAFADALQYVADPRCAHVPIEALLSKIYASKRRASIRADSIMPSVSFGTPGPGSDTVYLSVVDGDGNACSLINSLFEEFGTGLVVPGTGIALQNRGALFSLDPEHPNALAPGKRPYQTIIPALATRDDELWLSFGVMGGFQQPQGHLQVIANMVDFGMDPQRALDALRFSVDVTGDGEVRLEAGVDPQVASALGALGHRVRVVDGYERTVFGGGQVIARDPESGALIAGSEPRSDGAAVGW